MKRTAIVTGGTRGLGKAISIALQAQGCDVAAIYCSNVGAAQAFSTATGIRSYKWDVSDYDACREGIAAVEQDLGPADILVNNAGITSDAILHHMTPEQWWRVINNDLGSVFNMCRNIIDGMRERGFGRIINISSVNGQKGQAGQTNYAAAKAGILGFTRSLALEVARKNITVNAVAPGYCDTDMVAAVPPDLLKTIIAGIPVGRLGTPEDIARVVAFLASADAGFINGATFSVNGGQYMV
ncbi:MAG TPA: acetoacetyl-CoA reductase [Noviherbaspirillum sp.]|uniref:acetoacetyl-CoA reductase n=1 Tax=Noviherbaspirillum sp. TaxID=1926288 RepID=UPI002B47FA75|nr:acetoacetyl-CoA reductase [Noviherbaspirillum sp.]HJV87731.1 acetoacetyl-CoA reductase [Noviherbaspirillum sp.]